MALQLRDTSLTLVDGRTDVEVGQCGEAVPLSPALLDIALYYSTPSSIHYLRLLRSELFKLCIAVFLMNVARL